MDHLFMIRYTLLLDTAANLLYVGRCRGVTPHASHLHDQIISTRFYWKNKAKNKVLIKAVWVKMMHVNVVTQAIYLKKLLYT